MKILVTGCNSDKGIGQLIAKTLACEGNIVYASMRDVDGKNKENAEKLEDFAREHKLSLQVIDMDVTNDESVKKAIDFIAGEEGKIDVIINNAARLYPIGVIETITTEEAKSIYDVNFFGSMRVCNAALPYMRKHRSGLIIQISSLGAKTPIPFSSIYNSSKAAVEALTLSYRFELKQFGIDAVVVQLGYFPGTKIHEELSTGSYHNVFEKEYSPEWQFLYEQSTHSQDFRQHLLASKKGKYYDAQIVADKIMEIINMKEGERPFQVLIETDHKLVEPRQLLNRVHDELLEEMNALYGFKFIYNQKNAGAPQVSAIIQQRIHSGLHSPTDNKNAQSGRNLEPWRTLITFKPPIDLIQKSPQFFASPLDVYRESKVEGFNQQIQRLSSSVYWPLHCIEEGFGPLNIDFYPVSIRQMPILPKQQHPCTPEELLQYIRLNFNKVINPKLAKFELYNESDIEKWQSEDYLGTLLHIDFAPQLN